MPARLEQLDSRPQEPYPSRPEDQEARPEVGAGDPAALHHHHANAGGTVGDPTVANHVAFRPNP
jgi:hypothetical protein